jgi:hypothetical protein
MRFEQLGHLASMTSENMMQIALRVIAGSILGMWSYVATAQPAPPAAPPNQQQSFGPGELVDAGQRFFGGVSQGFAGVIEKAISQWGLPNGYVLGEEAGGAFIGGLRYGEGTLYTKNAGDLVETCRRRKIGESANRTALSRPDTARLCCLEDRTRRNLMTAPPRHYSDRPALRARRATVPSTANADA